MISDCFTMNRSGITRSATRRTKVIETARKLFVDQGFHATGIAQIANRSGVAVGQIYRDFACKEDIIAEIVQQDCVRFLDCAALKDAIVRHDADAVRAWIGRIVDPPETADDARLITEILAESSRNARIAEIFRAVHHDVRTNMLAALEVLAPSPGSVRRLAELADTILTLSMGLLHRRIGGDAAVSIDLGVSLRRIVESELDLLCDEQPMRSTG